MGHGTDQRTHVNVSPNPPSSPASLNLTLTAPLFPRYAGPQPVHDVCTSATRGKRSSRMYTNKATLTFTTVATREYFSLFGALASIWERMRELRLSITLLERPATGTTVSQLRFTTDKDAVINLQPRCRGRSSWKPTATTSGARGSFARKLETWSVGDNQSTRSCGTPESPCRLVLYDAVCTRSRSLGIIFAFPTIPTV